MDCGFPYDQVLTWPLATIWAEFGIIQMRVGGQMADESMLMQSMLTAWFSGKGGDYKKHIERVRNGW